MFNWSSKDTLQHVHKGQDIPMARHSSAMYKEVQCRCSPLASRPFISFFIVWLVPLRRFIHRFCWFLGFNCIFTVTCLLMSSMMVRCWVTNFLACRVGNLWRFQLPYFFILLWSKMLVSHQLFIRIAFLAWIWWCLRQFASLQNLYWFPTDVLQIWCPAIWSWLLHWWHYNQWLDIPACL